MIGFCFNINKKYAMDVDFFYKNRRISDGITFFEFVCNLDLYEGDHRPAFYLNLNILNFMIFDFSIYNKHHTKTS